MGLLLMLLWLATVVVLWTCVVKGFRETANVAEKDKCSIARIAFLYAAIPPTLVFMVSAFVLFQAAPTVQFNVESHWSLKLWSFWVHCWPAIFGCSGFQAICYLIWLLGSLIVPTRKSIRQIVGIALLATVCGSLLLNLAFPSA